VGYVALNFHSRRNGSAPALSTPQFWVGRCAKSQQRGGTLRKRNLKVPLTAIVVFASLPLWLAGCGATLQSSKPLHHQATKLVDVTNSNTVPGTPRQTYLRIAKQASKCWFGPFGSAHHAFMTSADVPPPSSSAPVTMKVHRRLQNIKKPWGSVVLRVTFSGTTTTTLSYENVGLDQTMLSRMTNGMTHWGNQRDTCPALLDIGEETRPTSPARR